MNILKKTADDFLNYMISYARNFDEHARKKLLTKNLEELIYNFNSKVDSDTIYIECYLRKINT